MPSATDLLSRLDHARGITLLTPDDRRPGSWIGGPSAVAYEGGIALAYRMRRPVGEGRGFANVIAVSTDGVELRTVATVTSDRHDCDSLERPSLLRVDGGWRLYISCATKDSKHWRVDLLQAPTLEELPDATPVPVLPGDPDVVAVKDPVIRRFGDTWHLWASLHPLDDLDATDRMRVDHATSSDGLSWTWHGTALPPTPGSWDQRGTRPAAVLDVDEGLLMFYDGRASEAENWDEKLGAAVAPGPDADFRPIADRPVFTSPEGTGSIRYLTSVADPTGRTRVYYESARADGSHELRTQLL